MGTQEKPAGTAMGRRPQSIGEEFGRVPIRDDPELGTYFLKPPKCHIAIYGGWAISSVQFRRDRIELEGCGMASRAPPDSWS